MTAFSITSLKGYDVSKDGRIALLHFVTDDDEPISLRLETMELEAMIHEVEFLLMKARELSDLSKQGVVSTLRPETFRAALSEDGTHVILTFRLRSGLELHYGLEPTLAEELVDEIHNEAERGEKAKVTRN